jgi:fatty acid desaturase
MLHCTCHRKLFIKKQDWANYYLPWIIGPFFGQTPETYFSHHIGMHHPENNLPSDKSSTMFYQRDSFLSFLSYFSNFFFIGIFELSSYFQKKKRTKLLRNTILGESAFFLLCILLSLLNWQATLVVFILPFLISRFIMMLGNWTQHAFVDATDPGNPYKNSITCINTPYNHKCWNDGYHTSHHIKPNIHWSEHPLHFLENKNEYIKNKAIVFDGMGFLEVYFCLMLGRYDILERNFVNMGNDSLNTPQEVINLLRERTRKINYYQPLSTMVS